MKELKRKSTLLRNIESPIIVSIIVSIDGVFAKWISFLGMYLNRKQKLKFYERRKYILCTRCVRTSILICLVLYSSSLSRFACWRSTSSTICLLAWSRLQYYFRSIPLKTKELTKQVVKNEYERRWNGSNNEIDSKKVTSQCGSN